MALCLSYGRGGLCNALPDLWRPSLIFTFVESRACWYSVRKTIGRIGGESFQRQILGHLPVFGVPHQKKEGFMKSVNKVILLGNVGKDPEVKFTPNGTAVAKFTMATNSRYKDQGGEWQERTEWHSIVAWQRLAEIAGEY